MKGDFTRNTFKKDKRYSSVRMQQGRLQLDADWNEQVDITNKRIENEGVDIIGLSGAPRANPGFEIQVENNNIKILAARDANQKTKMGHFYVDGILCEIDRDYFYTEQPDFPGVNLPNLFGYYLAYLDVWQRHITVIEDPSLREEALGDADTATRTKTIWQVKLLEITAPTGQEPPCAQQFSEWTDVIANRQARLAARVVAASSQSTDQCVGAAQQSSQIMANQLYRLEIHKAGAVGQAEFKWSRDNGSVIAAIDSFNATANTMGINMPSRDDVLRFEAEQWVELIDEVLELKDGVGILVKLTAPTIGTTLTYDPDSATGSIPFSRWQIPEDREKYKPKVRRWDHKNSDTIITSSSWIDLEDGIQVRFGESGKDNYQIGDYWLIPARAISRNVEWPIDESTGSPKLEERHGIERHYCRLAILNLKNDGNWEMIEDCHKRFPSLTTICADDVCYDSSSCQGKNPECGWEKVNNVQQALEKICETGIFCRDLDDLRADGIVRNADGSLGFEITGIAGDPPQISYTKGIAYVAGCRHEVDTIDENGAEILIDLDSSTTHQLLLVNDKGSVELYPKGDLPEKYAAIAVISTYQGIIKRIIDVRFDLTHLDEKVENNLQSIRASKFDRRQFVPLLAHSIKGLQYRDGRNARFDLSQATPPFVGIPAGLASDGENIWIANSAGNMIAKIPREATDSSEIATVDLISEDAQSQSVAFDGCCVWFTLPQRNSVARINPNNNNEILEIPVGLIPHGIAFDGDFIWVCNYANNSISIIDVETCQVVRTFLLINPETGQAAHPDSIAFDGTHIWVAAAPNMLFKIEKPWGDPEMVEVPDQFKYEKGQLAFDGAYLWISSQDDLLVKVEITSHECKKYFFELINTTQCITFDGTCIWACEKKKSGFMLHKIDPVINRIMGDLEMDKELKDVPAAIFDGSHLWISTDKNIQKKLV